jgi:hypothetical protein
LPKVKKTNEQTSKTNKKERKKKKTADPYYPFINWKIFFSSPMRAINTLYFAWWKKGGTQGLPRSAHIII